MRPARGLAWSGRFRREAALCPLVSAVLTSGHPCQAARPAGTGALQRSGQNGGATSALTLRIQGSAARQARSDVLGAGARTVPGPQSSAVPHTAAAAGRLSPGGQRRRTDRATGVCGRGERQEGKVIIWRGGVNGRQIHIQANTRELRRGAAREQGSWSSVAGNHETRLIRLTGLSGALIVRRASHRIVC